MLYMKKEYIKSQSCNISAIKSMVFDDLKVVSIIGIWAEVKKKDIFLRLAIKTSGKANFGG